MDTEPNFSDMFFNDDAYQEKFYCIHINKNDNNFKFG